MAKKKDEEELIPEIPVSEDTLEETIRVIKTGLAHHHVISPTTRNLLSQWCSEREAEIHAREHPDGGEE